MLYAFCKFWCRLYVFLFYPTRVLGRKKLEKGVVVCNHFEAMDIPVVGVKIPFRLCAIAKKELFEKRFTGWFLRRLGGIPVDRQAPGAGTIKQVVMQLKGGRSLLIFPEGTRNRTGSDEMQDIKGGASLFALMAGSKIIPVRLRRPPKFWRRNVLAVGDPIEFEGKYNRENMEALDNLIIERMAQLKTEIDEFVTRKQRKRARAGKVES